MGPLANDILEDTDLSADKFPVKYVTAVSIICNLWRGPGVHARLRDFVEDAGADAEALLPRVPGRCIRTRWGSAAAASDGPTW